MDALTKNERVFVNAYLESGAMIEAHRRAYPGDYSDRSRQRDSNAIMRRPAVEAAVAAAHRRQQRRHDATIDRTLIELLRVGALGKLGCGGCHESFRGAKVK